MELMAVIVAIEALKTNKHSIKIYSDSSYVVKAVEEGWLKTWIANDFKGGKKNKDLWRRFYDLSATIKLKFVWVKGHAENVYNIRCDVLATLAADNGPYEVDTFYEREMAATKKL
jgi:ribonuclease HI